MRCNRVNYIYWLSQIQYSERSLVGNQLFLLSQLLQRECSLLPGFVLSDDLWRQFLGELKTVKLVWSKLFSASSLLYWHRLGLSLDRVNLSILVRPLKTAYAT